MIPRDGTEDVRTMNDYELAGVETITRGICIRDGHILLCRAKGGATTYLPGGHIEFGETGRMALAREIREELGATARIGAFRGVVENSFLQKGKPHAEINLVYDMDIPDLPRTPAAHEDWLAFEWRPLGQLDDLLPAAFRTLSTNPTCRFEP